MKLVLALIVAFAIVASASAQSGEVLILTDDNFDASITEHSHVLVEFFAPWCGHCKKLAPEYEKAAKALGDTAVLASVDATEYPDLGQKFGVRGYPTLKWFVNGEPKEYTGGRDEATIVSWIEKKLLPASTLLDTVEAVKSFISENPTAVVAYLEDASGDDFVEYVAAAGEDVFTSQKFAHVVDAAIAKALDAEVPSIEVYQDGKEDSASKTDAEDFDTKNFLFDAAFPLVEEINRDVYQRLMAKGNPIVIVFSDPAESDIKDFVTETAEANKAKLSFSTADSSSMAETAGRMGASGTVFPIALVITIDEEAQSQNIVNWDEDVTFDKNSFATWISAVVDGTAKTWTKSEPLPESNDGPVKILVGKNYDEIVNDSTKDVIVEFYAPWCGHCKSLAPIYDSIGQAFKDAGVDSVVIAKMDATANGLSEDVQVLVQGFPTLLFFPANDKTPVEYNDARTASAIVAFLDENVSIDFDVATINVPEGDDDEEEEDFEDEDWDEVDEDEDEDEDADDEAEDEEEAQDEL